MNKPSSASKKIGIFGHVGTGNLGDEAIIAAVIQNIKRRSPDVEIFGFSFNPDDTQERHKVAAFPIRRISKDALHAGKHGENTVNAQHPDEQEVLHERIRRRLKGIPLIYSSLKATNSSVRCILNFFEELTFLAKCFKNLKGINLLIIAGSGQLSDHFGGAWGFPYTIFKWSVIAKLSRTKLLFLSVGAGPLNSVLSRCFIKNSLALASYRSFRDESSRKLVERIGVTGANPVFPDLANSLRVDRIPMVSRHENSPPVVGINAFPHYDHRYWPVSNRAVYNSYIRKLASFVTWLIGHNYIILFLPTQVRTDPLVIKDIKDILANKGTLSFKKQIIEQPLTTVNDLISQLSLTDMVVATRFHAILFSLLMNKPVVALSNHPKLDDLMRDMGLSEYLLNIDEFDLNSLIERFTSLESNSGIVKGQIERKVSEYRRALEIQYDQLFSRIEDAGAELG